MYGGNGVIHLIRKHMTNKYYFFTQYSSLWITVLLCRRFQPPFCCCGGEKAAENENNFGRTTVQKDLFI